MGAAPRSNRTPGDEPTLERLVVAVACFRERHRGRGLAGGVARRAAGSSGSQSCCWKTTAVARDHRGPGGSGEGVLGRPPRPRRRRGEHRRDGVVTAAHMSRAERWGWRFMLPLLLTPAGLSWAPLAAVEGEYGWQGQAAVALYASSISLGGGLLLLARHQDRRFRAPDLQAAPQQRSLGNTRHHARRK